MNEEERTKMNARLERDRDRVRRKIARIVGGKYGFGMLVVAKGVRRVVEDVEASPMLAKTYALDPAFRGAVKQLTDFAIPAAHKVELGGEVGFAGLTPADIAALKQPNDKEPHGADPARPEPDRDPAGDREPEA